MSDKVIPIDRGKRAREILQEGVDFKELHESSYRMLDEVESEREILYSVFYELVVLGVEVRQLKRALEVLCPKEKRKR